MRNNFTVEYFDKQFKTETRYIFREKPLQVCENGAKYGSAKYKSWKISSQYSII